MGLLNISNLPGVAAVCLSPNVFDIALTGTDISFTLYPNYPIKNLNPDDRVFILMDRLDGQGCILKWIGSNDCFIQDAVSFARLVDAHQPKRFTICLIVVEQVDTANNKLLGTNLPKKERWVIDIDDAGTLNVTPVM